MSGRTILSDVNAKWTTTTTALRLEKYCRNHGKILPDLSEKDFLKFNLTLVFLAKNEFLHSKQFKPTHSIISIFRGLLAEGGRRKGAMKSEK